MAATLLLPQVGGGATATAASDPMTPRSCAPTAANPVFSHVAGNRIVDTNGNVMMAAGMTLYGLTRPLWSSLVAQDQSAMTALADRWCANTIRIQASPKYLLDQAPYDATYLAAVKAEVSTALGLNMNVMLTYQSERGGAKGFSGSSGPNAETEAYWKVLAPLYADNQRVSFDVYNEWRVVNANTPQVWPYWLNGGKGYIGYQQLTSYVSSLAPKSLIIAEGPNEASTLNDLLNGYLIHGVANLAYSVHPYTEDKLRSWQDNFGSQSDVVPVVIGEWGAWPEKLCNPNEPSIIQPFFAYLQQKMIGMVAWGMVPGVQVTDTKNWTPTHIDSNWSCTVTPAQVQQSQQNKGKDGGPPWPGAEGTGQALMDYFIHQASAA